MASAPPTLPPLVTAVADAADRERRKLSLSFILGGGRSAPPEDGHSHGNASHPPAPPRPLPSMFRPFKTEPETIRLRPLSHIHTDDYSNGHSYHYSPAHDENHGHSYGRLAVRPLLHHRFAPLAPLSPLAPPPRPPAVSPPPSASASSGSSSQYVVSRRVAPTQPKKKTYEQMTKQEKRKARACRVDGCESYIINRGLCFRHGGGKRCAEPGCDSSAKNQGLCWKHGGSTNCIIDGCTRRGKARGLCWAHGGGTQCSAAGCTTIAVSNGKCWAHGGGKRCAFDGCTRAAYERTYNYCMKHHELLRDGRHSVDL